MRRRWGWALGQAVDQYTIDQENRTPCLWRALCFAMLFYSSKNLGKLHSLLLLTWSQPWFCSTSPIVFEPHLNIVFNTIPYHTIPSRYITIENMYLPIDSRDVLHMNDLHSRATCYRRYYGYYSCNSAWSRFGRWILAGVLIFIFVLFLFAAMCLARRRRRRNQISSTNQPMAYSQTGNTYNQPANNYDYSEPQTYAPPAGAPPIYGGGANQGYYNTGVTQPTNTYAK